MSVPGKLILAGEHAVVYGHPALVTAVDWRLEVVLERAETDEVELELPALGHRGRTSWEEILSLTATAREAWERFAASEPGSGHPLPEVGPVQLVQLALGEAVRGLADSAPPGLRLRIRSRLPPGAGFGSSAAVAAGVVGAYLALRGREDDPEALVRISLEVERRQHGLPSGVDSQAVVWGGLLWAERDDQGILRCRPLSGHSPLLAKLRVFHSGDPHESTGAVVAAVRRGYADHPQVFARHFRTIDRAARGLRDELAGPREDPERVLSLLRQCQRALEGLGVVPAATRSIIQEIEAAGGAAKLSGAGSLSGPGAGSVIAYHPEPSTMDRWSFLAGWETLPLALADDGFRREATS